MISSLKDPCHKEGPIKSLLPVSFCLAIGLSVCSSVQHFPQEWLLVFSDFWHYGRYLGKSFLPKFGQKRPKMTLNRVFWTVKKTLSLGFLGNNIKWKLILLLFHHQPHIWQKSGSSVMGWNGLSQLNCKTL